MGQIRNEKLLHQIAIRLKELREKKGVSQESVYIDTDIHIARIETAKINLSVSTLSKLCEYFGVSLIDFFAGIEKSKKTSPSLSPHKKLRVVLKLTEVF